MTKKLTLILLISWCWLMINLPVLAQSHAPDLIDDRGERERNEKHKPRKELEKKHNLGLENPKGPVRIDPGDPAGVTTNTPRPRIPSPSGAPGNQH